MSGCLLGSWISTHPSFLTQVFKSSRPSCTACVDSPEAWGARRLSFGALLQHTYHRRGFGWTAGDLTRTVTEVSESQLDWGFERAPPLRDPSVSRPFYFPSSWILPYLSCAQMLLGHPILPPSRNRASTLGPAKVLGSCTPISTGSGVTGRHSRSCCHSAQPLPPSSLNWPNHPDSASSLSALLGTPRKVRPMLTDVNTFNLCSKSTAAQWLTSSGACLIPPWWQGSCALCGHH